MISLIAASAFFLLIHFVVSGTRLRDRLVVLLREGPYRGAFALASVVGLIWMSRAYAQAPDIELWSPLPGIRPLALVLVFVAFLFVTIGLATPSPTRVGMESSLVQVKEHPRGMIRITRHPFLWGVALWALVHLAANGDLASTIFFGSLLVLALGGTTTIDAKRRRVFGDAWQRFADVTSNVPFAAILTGRNGLGPALREIGLLRPAIAIVAYTAFFALHGRLFGAALIF
jgi:uncharacterized membrane protein